MTVSISISEDQLFQAMTSYVTGVVAAQTFVAQDNRVPMPPVGSDYVVLTALRTTQLSTDRATWDVPNPAPVAMTHVTSTEWRCQIDVYGPEAQMNALALANLMRTDYAVSVFKATGFDVTPLFATEPRNTTLINSEQQYENRYTLEAALQINPVLQVPQQFASSLGPVGLVEVDTRYPAGD